MGGMTGKPVLQAVTTLLAMLILIPASGSLVRGRVPCRVPPPDLKNGSYVGSQEDRLALYQCDDQFSLKGPSQLECVTSADGNDSWVPHHATGEEFQDRPECHHTYCKDPGRSSNGQRTMILNRKIYTQHCCPPDTAVYHSCDEGYQLVGEPIIRCGANGTWDHARPNCKVSGSCYEFEVAHGRLTGERSGGDFFGPGDTVFVECDPGFRVDGTDQLFCKDDGMWDELVPTCVAFRDCQKPRILRGGYDGECCAPGDEVKFFCDDVQRYALSGVTNATCLPDGSWSEPLPICLTERSCDEIEVAHGRLTGERPGGDFFAPGDTAFLECDPGFRMHGAAHLFCKANGMWDKLVPTCVAFRDCQKPRILRGGYDGECCAPGDEVKFFCDDVERYALSGVASATCLPDGSWSEPLPICLDTYCKDPGRSSNGQRTMILKRRIYTQDCCPPDTAVYHSCDEGYQLVGEKIIRCGANGTWDHTRPKCKAEGSCDEFEVAHGRLTGERSDGDFFVPGDTAFVECDLGFRVDGTDHLFCKDDGMWDELVPTCVEYNCSRFDPGPNLIVEEFEKSNATIFPQGSSINFRCKPGYLLQGVYSTTCRGGGWFDRAPKCEQITCGHLRTPQHGWISGANSTAVGSRAWFHCFEGYVLMGSWERECQDYGEWSGSPVRCVPHAMDNKRRRISCLDPGAPDNGVQVGRSRFEIGSQVKFACNPGYYPRGRATMLCLPSGEWSARRPPLCLGKYYFDDERHVEQALQKKLNEYTQLFDSRENWYNTRNYVYFLFDASTSIGERNFRQGINLAKAITRKVIVSEHGNRIGAIVFSREADEVIQITECKSTEDALQKLDNIRYEAGRGTSIKAGIKQLERSIRTVLPVLGDRYKRVTFSVFIISGGKAKRGDSVDKVTIRGNEVEVYCIGIAGSTHMETLTKLASTPKSAHLFILRNYDALQWLAETLTDGNIAYGVCGITNEHWLVTRFEDIDEPQSRILNSQAMLHSWPWMVGISRIGAPHQVSCGGTIIANRWILTTASCMYSNMEERYLHPTDILVRARLIAAEKNLKDLEYPQSTEPIPTGELNTPKELLVEAIVLHNNYNRTVSEFLNDIALLRLKENINYEKLIRPICLPPAKGNIPSESTFYKKAAPAVVTGWGKMARDSTEPAGRLQQLMKEIGSEDDCRKVKARGPYTPQGMMCAKSKDGDPCRGNGGGPLMQAVKTEDTVWTQVGIVSWGFGCKKDRYSFYTDVSYYVPWIRSNLDAQAPAEAAVPGDDAADAAIQAVGNDQMQP